MQVSSIVLQGREPMIADVPAELPEIDRRNTIRHFEDRVATERAYFGSPDLPDCPVLQVDAAAVNSAETLGFIRDARPDAALVFGTQLLDDALRSALPACTINLHLGLSPRYRGAATLFWPFYFLEPAWAGATFHFLTAQADAGDIVHQVCPKLERADGIHDVGCRTVLAAADAAVRLLRRYQVHGRLEASAQRGGRNFRARDFRPCHLRVIYQLFDNDLVRAFIDGELEPSLPSLVAHPGLDA